MKLIDSKIFTPHSMAPDVKSEYGTATLGHVMKMVAESRARMNGYTEQFRTQLELAARNHLAKREI